MTQIYEEAIVPMEQGEIDQQEFFERGVQPLREFMYKQTQKEDVMVFMDIAGEEWESGAHYNKGCMPCQPPILSAFSFWEIC